MSQFGGGFDASQTQLSQSSFNRPQEYLLPITAAMLMNAEERETKLYINDRELSVVLFVGKVDEVVVSDRKFDYTVMDCSGMVKATKWIDEGYVLEEIAEGSYVTIYGKPSIFGGMPQLNCYKIMKCQSYDEVTQHYLSVIYAELHIKKVGLGAAKDPTGTAAMIASSAKPFPAGNDNNDAANLTVSQGELLALIRAQEHQTENGVNVNWLSDQLKRDTKDDLQTLMNEGQIYDTISEDWVKTT